MCYLSKFRNVGLVLVLVILRLFFELVCLLKKIHDCEVRHDSFMSPGKIFLGLIPLPVKIKLHLLSTFVCSCSQVLI